jgi:hypothetical protein
MSNKSSPLHNFDSRINKYSQYSVIIKWPFAQFQQDFSVVESFFRRKFNTSKFKKVQWSAPNFLRDSSVSPKQKTTKEQRVEARSLARNILEG